MKPLRKREGVFCEKTWVNTFYPCFRWILSRFLCVYIFYDIFFFINFYGTVFCMNLWFICRLKIPQFMSELFYKENSQLLSVIFVCLHDFHNFKLLCGLYLHYCIINLIATVLLKQRLGSMSDEFMVNRFLIGQQVRKLSYIFKYREKLRSDTATIADRSNHTFTYIDPTI